MRALRGLVMQIQGGIPKASSVPKLRESQIFSDLSQYADGFYDKNGAKLSSYFLKWGSQPMKNWSRQWEYPFVADQIGEISRSHPEAPIKALDAGSGCSFFPYFLASQHANLSVECFDYDPSLIHLFESIEDPGTDRIHFTSGDLRTMPFEENSYDLAYCISVLEHTNQYEEILNDFHRILKPGGSLVLTIDIAVDGANEIPPAEAQKILDRAGSIFQKKPEEIDLESKIKDQDCLTTKWVKENNEGILPWVAPRLSAFRAGLKRGKLSFFPYLTVYGGVWTKT